jgi:hypothetical protein
VNQATWSRFLPLVRLVEGDLVRFEVRVQHDRITRFTLPTDLRAAGPVAIRYAHIPLPIGDMAITLHDMALLLELSFKPRDGGSSLLHHVLR